MVVPSKPVQEWTGFLFQAGKDPPGVIRENYCRERRLNRERVTSQPSMASPAQYLTPAKSMDQQPNSVMCHQSCERVHVVDNRRNRVYAGETIVGYFAGDSWVRYIWIDLAQKKQLGH